MFVSSVLQACGQYTSEDHDQMEEQDKDCNYNSLVNSWPISLAGTCQAQENIVLDDKRLGSELLQQSVTFPINIILTFSYTHI